MSRTPKLSRRQLMTVSGLGAGGWLLAPLFSQLVREAHGQAANRAKVVFIVPMNHKGWMPPLTPHGGSSGIDLQVGDAFAALEPYKQNSVWIDGLFNPYNLDLHGNRHYLSAAPELSDGSPGAVTIDRFIGQQVGASSPFSALALSAFGAEHSEVADGPGQTVPLERVPAEAFAKIFGGPSAGPIAQSARDPGPRADLALFSLLREDVTRLNSRLVGPEREKLQQYLNSLEELDKRITLQQVGQASCDAPSALPYQDVPSQAAAMIDVGVQAFACGMTRVLTLALSDDGQGLPHLGPLGDNAAKHPGHHHMWHEEGTEQNRLTYFRFVAENVALLLKRLTELQLADDTFVVWTDSTGGVHHGGSYSHKAWIFGSGGGFFQTGGRYLKLPDSQVSSGDARVVVATGDVGGVPSTGRTLPHYFLGDFWATVANAMGVPIDCFGDKRATNGAIPGLRA